MNTLCIVLLVSLTGYVRIVAVDEVCGDPTPLCGVDMYCEDLKCKIKAGMTCSDSPADQCIKGATCTNTKCECGANHTANADMTMCLMNIGETCVTKADCVEGDTDHVVCDTDKKCACAAMYAANDMMNMCKLKLNETCSADGDCGINAECSTDKKCACKANSVNEENKCVMIIGETCVTKTDCVEGETDRVVCDADKKCACAATYAANDMMNMCKLKLNETCSAGGDCGINAECSTGTDKRCACKANFVNEEDRCGMKVGGACTGDTHCVMNAECKSEKCACKGTYTSDGDYCKSGSAAVVASLLLLVAALVTSRLM